jgi:SAM-dependent methyltransferase
MTTSTGSTSSTGYPEFSPTRLNFSLDFDEREPVILVTTPEGEIDRILGRYGKHVQHIFVPLPAGSIDQITAFDVVEHALDEPFMLAEFARLLKRGGRLDLRVPADGLTGWLDAVNAYQYLKDISGKGRRRAEAPLKQHPAGWHRHYRKADLLEMVTDAGFDIVSVDRTNPGLWEIPHFAKFFLGDFVQGDPDTEGRLTAWRRRSADRENRIPAGPLGTRFTIVAHRT